MCLFENTAALPPTPITNMKPETLTANLATVLTSFTMVTGHPTYDDIKSMHDALTAILIAIPYNETNGTHYLWGLITPTAAYKAIYMVPLPHPTKPAFYPNTTTIANDAKNIIRAQAKA